jgi:dolichyl-phosphate beta-glucosyltransferase
LAISASKTFLSIVIPAHNEERRLPTALEKIHAFLQTQSYACEIIVVENGSTDRTLALARDFVRKIPNLHVIQETQRGKGLAVRSGMLAASGAYRFFADVDLSMPIEQVNRFLPPQLSDYDVAIGSREALGAVRYGEPSYRHLTGRIFNSMVRWMALPGLQDTQCGFKCFRGDVAERVFPLQTMTGWSFDVEVLYIARLLGYDISEIPIDWYYNGDSRVRLFDDSLRMAMDLMQIRRNAAQGLYDPSLRPG